MQKIKLGKAWEQGYLQCTCISDTVTTAITLLHTEQTILKTIGEQVDALVQKMGRRVRIPVRNCLINKLHFYLHRYAICILHDE